MIIAINTCTMTLLHQFNTCTMALPHLFNTWTMTTLLYQFSTCTMTIVFRQFNTCTMTTLLHAIQHLHHDSFVSCNWTPAPWQFCFVQFSTCTVTALFHTIQQLHRDSFVSYNSTPVTWQLALLHTIQHLHHDSILHTAQHDCQLYYIQINFTLTTKAILTERALSSGRSENNAILHLCIIGILKLHTVHHLLQASSSSVWNRNSSRGTETGPEEQKQFQNAWVESKTKAPN